MVEVTKTNGAEKNGTNGKPKKPRVVVCIPAYNEENSIAGVIINAMVYADKVIVCDDGSKDNTAEVAKRMGAEVISNPVNMGKGFCLKTLFDYAREEEADIVVTIDADGQHDPKEIPRLLEPILENRADLVIGSRYMKGSWTDAPRYRRLGLRILNSLTNLGEFGVKDTQSGFRAFSARAFRVLTWVDCNGFGVEAEQLRKAIRHKMRVVEVPVSIRYKGVGKTSKKNPVAHGLDIAATALKLIVEDYPLFILGIPGALLFLMGLGLGINLLQIFNATRHFDLYLVAVAASFLFGGVILAVTSILLYAISKIGDKIERK
ncbi:MAG: glycosyltransferase family 2 protein [Candidatus Methanosuratincola sp.]